MIIGRNKNHFPSPVLQPQPQQRALPPPLSSAGSFFISSGGDRYLAGCGELALSGRLCRCVACIIRRFLSVCPQSVRLSVGRFVVGRSVGWSRLRIPLGTIDEHLGTNQRSSRSVVQSVVGSRVSHPPPSLLSPLATAPSAALICKI